jgi:elongation factor G
MPNSASHGEHRIAGPRLIAIVGPFQSGKTSLLEGLLARGGAVARQGAVREGTTVGDASPEARTHQMSVEPNVAHVDYMGDRITFVDCPGSVEFAHATREILSVCDAAVVVCETDPRKVQALRIILHDLEELKLPRFLFLNKIDQAGGALRAAL